jgi:pimeloyl-ACP methyl ester carboxylesterase
VADVVANGVRFHVQRMGNGPRTVVFLHGFLIDNLSGFYLTLSHALADRYSLVMYDLRGHGRSERPAEGYSLSQMTLDLDALLRELGLGQDTVTLIGNSSGVTLALAFAARFPARVEGLVLIDGVIDAREFARRLLSTMLTEEGDVPPDGDDIWANWIKQHYIGDQLDRDGEDTSRLLGRLDGQRRSPLLDAARGLVYKTDFVANLRGDPPYEEDDLRVITCPVLALYGNESDINAEAERLHRLIPHAEVVFVPEAGHGILRQAAGRMREEVTDWLRRTDRVAT